MTLPEFSGPIPTEHLRAFVMPGPTALIFATNSERPLYDANWRSTFAPAHSMIGIVDGNFHDIRHAAATLAAQSGATLADSMGCLGHSTSKAALGCKHTDSKRGAMIAVALGEAAAAVREGKVIPVKSRQEIRPQVAPG